MGARLGDRLDQMGLPDPFGEPHPLGAIARQGVDALGKPPDLPVLVVVGDGR
ncbi:hypothetical protein D3C78_1962320 [compost metagenome]